MMAQCLKVLNTVLTLWFWCESAAISTVVSIAEILKNNGLATEKSKISHWMQIYFSIYYSMFKVYDIDTHIDINVVKGALKERLSPEARCRMLNTFLWVFQYCHKGF